ncbi:proline racemase family protein [Portibacter marinus]|uniref:proline racemase family protein n=1 Tax=Portibacter marinus TaxID=2898660 RepID=UPI001F17B3CE|nr:proline racemase family protein [Portibacter marinus]
MIEKIRNTLKSPFKSHWLRFEVIDLHTGGEPLRVILQGYPEIKGANVLEMRRYCEEYLDDFRKLLMYEPRGHADMYGCILTPPNDEGADFGIIFMHNEGYSTMCGHAIIAISKLAAEMEWITIHDGENILRIDAPCGRIVATIVIKRGKVEHISFQGVPSFVVGLDLKIKIAEIGEIVYDLAYGGAFYAYVDLKKNNLSFHLNKDHYRPIIECGMKIKNAIIESKLKIAHPFEQDLSFLYGTIFIDHSVQKGISDSVNVCVFADGEVDRSPTGSGVCGRMAIHFQRNEIDIGEKMKIESITGSVFEGWVRKKIDYGEYKAVIPVVSGSAYITGQHTFCLDPEDYFQKGILLR